MRKRGFSLVELLIVLAVIAALIATITPVAFNAIKKAQATKVAQNLKTLASSFENKAYVDGAAPSSISDLGRDIDTAKYGVAYTESAGDYTVVVFTTEDVDFNTVQGILKDAVSSDPGTSGYTFLSGGLNSTTGGTVFYEFSFVVY
ncbi:type II secretion system protein [Kosmotoga sp.]|uniref:type II secretion system protein n=1 Tax=Kosmotoga sp. TaxID=1955248 RepID=UPI0024ABF47D|nr:type II secretion system protein [Kosmotoga sp.]MDI3524370.1 type pilus assembly protein PilA [Kosmotoga sp.]